MGDEMMELVRTDQGIGVETGDGLMMVRQVIGIGRNYAEHAHEQGAALPEHPMVFTKNVASVCLDGDEIVVPAIARDEGFGGNQTDFEAELAVIIGRDCKDVSAGEAMGYVLGLCCGNDVSARWWQKKGSNGQFCRGKGFDTFCPLGPRLVGVDEIEDVGSLRVRCRVNGELMQDGDTSQMIFPLAELIADLSRGTTLVAGTVILTGTPSGVGMARDPQVWLQDGDLVEVEIDGVGVLRNSVRFG